MQKLTFKQWIVGLDDTQAMKHRIETECYISASSLNNYLNGRPVPPLVQEKINNIAEMELVYPVKKGKTNDQGI